MTGSSAPRISVWSRTDWWFLVALSLAAVVAFLAGLGSFGILDPSDGYYSEGAREMFQSGDWLTPCLNYTWFFDKPIMNYWLIASCYKLFGVSEFASRLPAAVCGAALVPALYVFARQFYRRRAALLAALALLSSPMWLILGHMSLTDMPLTFFTWIALLSLFVALETKHGKIVWLAYIAIGCGLLTKGPLSVFLVALNLGVYVLLRRPSIGELFSLLKRLYVIPGLALSLAIAAPWYLLVNAATHGVFVQEFFLNQNINRAMGTVDHKAGPFYYVPVVLGAAFPWTLFLLLSARNWFRPWLCYVKRRVDSPRMRATAFGVTTSGAILIFFSLLPTKLVTYLLPVLPALALLTGVTIDKQMRLPNSKRGLTSAVALLIFVIGLAGEGGLILSVCAPQTVLVGGRLGVTLQQFLQSGDAAVKFVLIASFLTLSAAGLALLSFTTQGKITAAYRYFVGLSVLAVVVTVPAAIVLSYQQKCRDMQELVGYARDHRIEPVMLGHRTPSAIFYMGRAIKFLAGTPELIAFLEKEPAGASPVCILVHRNVFDDVAHSGSSLTVIRESGDWVLGRTR